jgi:hypothetical protein
MPRIFVRVLAPAALLGLVVMLASSMALAQSYQLTKLVSNLSGQAKHGQWS